jgi:hypothetical protein
MWPFPFRRDGPRAPPAFNPGRVVTYLTPHDSLTLGQLCEGCLIVGSTGSGKTSGPADAIVRGLLREGCGFLWLCAKPDEYARAERLCEQAGRLSDLVRFAPGCPHRLDVLDTEIRATGLVEAGAQLLDGLLRLASRSSRNGGSEDVFWQRLAARIIRQAITVVFLATGGCSVGDISEVVTSAPTTEEEYESDAFAENSLCVRLIHHAAGLDLTATERRDLEHAARFLLVEFRRLADKTRTIGLTMVENVCSRFVTGPLAQLLSSGETTLPPSAPQDGAIIVCDFPVLTYREEAQFLGSLMKQVVARATLRRTVTPGMRPVVVFADECHLFSDAEQDAMTQTVARASRLISVNVTQNLPTLYTAGGGESAKQAVDSWIGNHQTKIVCSNSCAESNRFFSEMFGYERKLFFGGSTGGENYDPITDMLGGSMNVSASFQEQWQPTVPAQEYTTLAKGGPPNFVVEAFAFQGGRRWSNGRTHMKVRFHQRT